MASDPSSLTAAYDALMAAAEARQMDIDIETATLVPKPTAGMAHHERDVYYRLKADREHWREVHNNADNEPGSPEQAWA